MVHFGPFWPEEVHFGLFRSANRTLATPEQEKRMKADLRSKKDLLVSFGEGGREREGEGEREGERERETTLACQSPPPPVKL